MEKVNGFNYRTFVLFLRTRIESCQSRNEITKEDLRRLLLLCQSDRERQCVRYTVFKASGVTSSAAQKIYGFQNSKLLSREVEDCIVEAETIRQEN